MKQTFIVIIACLTFLVSKANRIDSLLQIVEHAVDDSVVMNASADLSWEYHQAGELDLAFHHVRKSINIAKRLQLHGFIAGGYSELGIFQAQLGYTDSALYYFNASAEYAKAKGHPKQYVRALNNLSHLQRLEGNLATSLETILKVIEAATATDDQDVLSIAYTNAAAIYTEVDDLEQAAKFLDQADASVKFNSQPERVEALIAQHRAQISLQTNNWTEHHKYLDRARELCLASENTAGLVSAYADFCSFHIKLSHEESSQSASSTAKLLRIPHDSLHQLITYTLGLAEQLDDSLLCANLYGEYAVHYIDSDPQKAFDLAQKGLHLAKTLDLTPATVVSYRALGKASANLNRKDEAIAYFKKMDEAQQKSTRDSEMMKLTKLQFQYEYAEQIRAQEAENAQINLEMKKETEKTNLIVFFSIAILTLGGIFIWLLLNRVKVIKLQQSELLTSNSKLKENADLLQAKNLQIHASIKYANSIQKAILPNPQGLQQIFEHSFTFNEPKEVVSGDLYWYKELNHGTLVAIGDCSGHGVPGAFLSIISLNVIEQIVLESGLYQPHKLLKEFNSRLKMRLQAASAKDVSDLFDVSICFISNDRDKVWFAGSRNPLWVLRDGEVEEYMPDRIHMAGDHDSIDFQLVEIDAKKGDRIFMTTDGLQKQKLVFERLDGVQTSVKDLLQDLNGADLASQQKSLSDRIFAAVERGEQEDDITIVAFEL